LADTQKVLQTPTGVSVDRLNLITGIGAQPGLSLQLVKMDIFEDIFNQTLSATVVIEDALNLVEMLSLCGQEWLFVRISKPGFKNQDGNDASFAVVFRVYKIEKLVTTSSFVQQYIMHLAKEESVVSQQILLSGSYTNQKPENIVRDIFARGFSYADDNFMNSSFEGGWPVETGASGLTLTIPNMKPLDAIATVASLSTNPETKINDYLFFESTGGYRFASLSDMFNQPAYMDISYRVKAIVDPKDEALGAIDPYLNSYSPMALESEVYFDYLRGIMRGQYGVQHDTFDLATQTYKANSLTLDKFESDYKKDNTLNKFSLMPETDWKELITKDSNKTVPYYRVFSVLPGIVNNVNDTLHESVATRVMQIASITSQKVKLTMPGSPELRVGRVVNLNYPSIATRNADDEREKMLHKYLSGRYLITAVRHVITLDEWYSYCELAKESSGAEYPLLEGKNYTLEGL
jgi:hypothetical protein